MWRSKTEHNSQGAFDRALQNGFGIETDVRDFNGQLVISHDVPNDNCISFAEFLEQCSRYPQSPLALNIKADGLQTLLMSFDIDNPHFFFDMSVPDMLGYAKSNLTYYSRYSDLEPQVSLYEGCKGIWLDNFSSNELNQRALTEFVEDSKLVALVSPELHGLCHKRYWNELKQLLKQAPQCAHKLSICTDFPVEAKVFFNE